jgi:hypothetical protein
VIEFTQGISSDAEFISMNFPCNRRAKTMIS